MTGAAGREPVRKHRLVETELATVYRHCVRLGKAGVTEVDVYPCLGNQLNGRHRRCSWTGCGGLVDDLGEIDLRGVLAGRRNQLPAWPLGSPGQRISALLGVQPKLTQVPPVNSF